jgi:hypothetical protein
MRFFIFYSPECARVAKATCRTAFPGERLSGARKDYASDWLSEVYSSKRAALLAAKKWRAKTGSSPSLMPNSTRLANHYGYDVVNIVVENRHENKNIHNVPDDVIERKKKNLK